MRSIIFILSLLAAEISAQPFVQYYDHSLTDKFRRARATSDGGYIMCGSKGGQFGQNWILKVNAMGEEEWSLAVPGAGEAFDIQELPGDGYIVTGGRPGPDSADSLSIWRIDTDGILLWQKRHLPGQQRALGRSIIPFPNGGHIICGRSGISGLTHDALVMKVDDEGELEWFKNFDLGGLDEAIRILDHPTWGYMMLATTSADGAYHSSVLMRLDQSGDSLWTMPLGGSELELSPRMIRTSAPGFLIMKRTTPAAGQPGDIHLDHRDLDGMQVWSNSIGTLLIDEMGHEVIELQNGGFLIAVENGTVGWMKVDAQGELFDEAGVDIGPALDIVALMDHMDGSLVMAGNVVTDTIYTGFHTDGFLLRTGLDGAMSILTHDQPSISIHPNPASDVVLITTDHILLRMEITDLSGRMVLSSDMRNKRELQVDALKPGHYILTIITDQSNRRSHQLSIQR